VRRAFVDTAGWMMLADEADPLHRRAVSFRDRWLLDGGLFVCSDYVMDETLTLLRLRLGLDAAREWWEVVQASARVSWDRVDASRAERALTWFFRWKDKSFSFTDCTSFVIMKERRIRLALTSDKHFVQAGFETAPR
jgi:predicted nucleic acid-binding protein